jgi:hypothetical protein
LGVSAIIRTSEELQRYRATESDEPIAEAAFRQGFAALLDKAPPGLICESAFLSVPANLSAWLDTGLDCPAGEAVTLFSTARTDPPPAALAQLSAEERLWHSVRLHSETKRCPWHRVGADGEVMRGSRTSHTFTPPRPGRLYLAPTLIEGLAAAAPEAAADDLYADDQYERPRVYRCVLVVRWAADPLDGLRTIREIGDVGGLLASEIARHEAALPLPVGWRYPPVGGGIDQFVADAPAADDPIIGCCSRDNGALLMKDATLPFRAGTMLNWTWKVDQIPSAVAEDRLEAHDYLSIAVEFDNGRDLAYYWSAALPAETGYPCPIPGWANRETHVVVRSGAERLGAWFDEERDVYADYRRYVGGDPPGAILRIWLLTVTFFQGLEGRCEYGRIELANDAARLRVN